jgi:hypothetical protein
MEKREWRMENGELQRNSLILHSPFSQFNDGPTREDIKPTPLPSAASRH